MCISPHVCLDFRSFLKFLIIHFIVQDNKFPDCIFLFIFITKCNFLKSYINEVFQHWWCVTLILQVTLWVALSTIVSREPLERFESNFQCRKWARSAPIVPGRCVSAFYVTRRYAWLAAKPLVLKNTLSWKTHTSVFGGFHIFWLRRPKGIFPEKFSFLHFFFRFSGLLLG